MIGQRSEKKNKKYLSLQCCETTGLKKYHKANAKKQQKAYKTTYKEDKFRTNIGTIMQNLLQCCGYFNFELVHHTRQLLSNFSSLRMLVLHFRPKLFLLCTLDLSAKSINLLGAVEIDI